MKDIVTELRDFPAGEDSDEGKLMDRAADEIEQLRRIADLVYNDYRKEAWEEAWTYFKDSGNISGSR